MTSSCSRSSLATTFSPTSQTFTFTKMDSSAFSRFTSKSSHHWVRQPAIVVLYGNLDGLAGGYLNESGVINTIRLQVLLDQMQEWEQEIFQREYSDMNWIKGKQSKYSQPAQSGNSAIGLSYFFFPLSPLTPPAVMTPSQKNLYDQVREFVLGNRSISPSKAKNAELSMPNLFSAEERAFLTSLAQDLHLTLFWDEYDEDDQNLVVLCLPSVLESHIDEEGSESDSQDEEEATAAIDRVLRKYDKREILVENAEGDFDSREELRLKEKMDEWKRAYYLVWFLDHPLGKLSNKLFRINSGCRMTIPTR